MAIDMHPELKEIIAATNGTTLTNGISEPSIEELETELPLVYDGQIPLGDLLSRVVQSIYAELSELAETSVLKFHPGILKITLNVSQNAKYVR